MLTKLALIGACVCVMPMAGQAQSASGTVNVKATVIPKCTIPPLTTLSLDFSKPSQASPSAVIDVVTKTATFPLATCNTATHVSISSLNGGASGGSYLADAGHQNFFDYIAVAAFDTATVSLDTTPEVKGATTATYTSVGTSSGPFTGNLTVAVTPFAPAHGLVAGVYADSVRVTLTAN